MQTINGTTVLSTSQSAIFSTSTKTQVVTTMRFTNTTGALTTVSVSVEDISKGSYFTIIQSIELEANNVRSLDCKIFLEPGDRLVALTSVANSAHAMVSGAVLN